MTATVSPGVTISSLFAYFSLMAIIASSNCNPLYLSINSCFSSVTVAGPNSKSNSFFPTSSCNFANNNTFIMINHPPYVVFQIHKGHFLTDHQSLSHHLHIVPFSNWGQSVLFVSKHLHL